MNADVLNAKKAIGTIFTQAELVQALQEVFTKKVQVSSLSKNGMYIGTTRNNGRGVYAVFTKSGIYVSYLNFSWGNTESGRLESIRIPDFLLELEGTELEATAVEFGKQLAILDEQLWFYYTSRPLGDKTDDLCRFIISKWMAKN